MKVGLAQGAVPSTATTVDLTDVDAGFASDVKAAILFGCHATAADTSIDDGRISIGLAANNGGTTQAAMALFTDDAVVTGSTVTSRYLGSANAYAKAANAAGAPVIAAGVSSWLSNGIRLNVTTPDGTAPLVNALLLGGDIEAKVSHGVFATGTPNDATIAHGLGGVPDFIIGISTGQAADNTGATNAGTSYFVWERTNGLTAGLSWKSIIVAGATQAVLDTRGTDFYDSIFNEALNVNSVGATNVVLRTAASTTYAARWHLLCVRGLTQQITTRAGWFQAPAGVGSITPVTGMSVAPQALLLMSTFSASTPPNSYNNGMSASTYGFGAAINNGGGIKQGSTDLYDEDAQTTTDSESRISTRGLFVPNSSGNVTIDADVSAFNSDGVSLNYVTNNGPVQSQALYLAFGLAAGAGGVPRPTNMDGGIQSLTGGMRN